MKRELGFGRCGLACCLCSENTSCDGCTSGNCPDRDWCINRKCSIEKGIASCAECENRECCMGMFGKVKPLGFTEFIRQYGREALLDCLEKNEENGVIYHRSGVMGDYDDFENIEELMEFIKNGN